LFNAAIYTTPWDCFIVRLMRTPRNQPCWFTPAPPNVKTVDFPGNDIKGTRRIELKLDPYIFVVRLGRTSRNDMFVSPIDKIKMLVYNTAMIRNLHMVVTNEG
jgi:hypothetical protein